MNSEIVLDLCRYCAFRTNFLYSLVLIEWSVSLNPDETHYEKGEIEET